MSSRTSDRRPLPVRHAVAAPHRAPAPSLYATQPAPQAEQVQVKKLKRGLRSGILFDVDTGRLLWARDPGAVLPIASLTKMMTALLVVARTRPTDTAVISPQAVHFTGSGVGELPLGKRVSVLALLYGLLLPSGNDAAIALAQHVAGSEQRFVAMMNARARQMGLNCTRFSSASGVVDWDNYSCPKDMAALAHAVLEQPMLSRIVASRSAILPFPINGGKLYLYSNNPLLLARYPGADGVKTGYTRASGQCLVATAKRGRTWIGVVLLHSDDAADQAQQLLNAGFQRLGG
jgi:D-alanyl-D-alanine carboxypeptidase